MTSFMEGARPGEAVARHVAPLPRGGREVVRAVPSLMVDEFTTERAFYAALKLHVHATVHDGLLSALMAGRAVLVDQTLRLEVGRFTARKANHLFVADARGGQPSSAEFHGFTSHKVREKLAHLHDRGVVDLIGRGLREAFTYRWKEPVRHWEVCSFMRFRPRTSDDLTLNLDLYRIFLERGLEPFTPRDFVDIYASVHGAEYGGSRWGQRKWERIAGSFSYAEALKARLDHLVGRGLVLAEGDRHRLDPDLRDALAHFDLFVNGPAYVPSRSMCDTCPLDTVCRAGGTQQLLVALNQA